MSLFPAYKEAKTSAAETVHDEETKTDRLAQVEHENAAGDWKSNTSFQASQVAATKAVSVSGSDDSSCDESSKVIARRDSCDSAKKNKDHSAMVKRICLEFDDTDEYYVDKKGSPLIQNYRGLAPRYTITLRKIEHRSNERGSFKRPRGNGISGKRVWQADKRTTEAKYSDEQVKQMLQRIHELKTLVANEPQCLAHWIELHELLGHNLEKSNRLAVAEHQLHMLENGLNHHQSNEALLQLYVATASATYADGQVASKIEQLLERNPFEYTLWTALIMATQGTMARCNVPDVLRIYEQSMRRMHLGYSKQPSNQQHQEPDTDLIMLKLFHNCVLFMRQSANNQLAFALLKLSFEMNALGVNLDCFAANAEDERPLIEFEELVLQSGMPMPEIWTRIERLRQAFNFLPYPQLARNALDETLDPQRCVYAEDVCAYIYPLKKHHNRMQLMLLIVQLTKLPFVRTNCLAERLCARLDQIGDSDAIEMMLAGLGDRYTYALPLAGDFNSALLDLVDEMCVVPTFMPKCIGHELYAQSLGALLLKCAEVFEMAADEPKRRVFILLWFRFERLQLVVRKLSGKLNDQQLRDARARIRKLLSLPVNRRVARFYTELGMVDFEMLGPQDDDKPVFRIFAKIICAQSDFDVGLDNTDLMHAYIVYAEMLMARNKLEAALNVLVCLALDKHATLDDNIDAPLREQALQCNQDRLVAALAEDHAPQLPLEDYFGCNRLLLLLRARCLMLHLLDRWTEARDLLVQLLSDNFGPLGAQYERRSFLREQLHELLMLVLQLAGPRNATERILEVGLVEFPRNLALLQHWSSIETLPWYKLRPLLVRTNAGILSLIHLVLVSRCRFANTLKRNGTAMQIDHERSCLEGMVRNRLLSVFKTFLPSNPHRSTIEMEQYKTLRRNALYWRCYLRCLSDASTSFEASKECLLTALDECPWDKALYIDGAIYVPQELVHLQDLMTEKQIRIYAIPEELDILRET